jgi:hypothetical protein
MDEVRELRDRLGQGGRAVTGARDTVDAFVRGQVDTLLLDPPSAAALTVRPADHEGLAVGAVSGLPADVRADLLLVALAALTAAEVAVLPQSTMFGSPVAALLRWEQPST